MRYRRLRSDSLAKDQSAVLVSVPGIEFTDELEMIDLTVTRLQRHLRQYHIAPMMIRANVLPTTVTTTITVTFAWLNPLDFAPSSLEPAVLAENDEVLNDVGIVSIGVSSIALP